MGLMRKKFKSNIFNTKVKKFVVFTYNVSTMLDDCWLTKCIGEHDKRLRKLENIIKKHIFKKKFNIISIKIPLYTHLATYHIESIPL